MKKRKIFILLHNGYRWTNDRNAYSKINRNEMYVIATTIKQAEYLAKWSTWYHKQEILVECLNGTLRVLMNGSIQRHTNMVSCQQKEKMK